MEVVNANSAVSHGVDLISSIAPQIHLLLKNPITFVKDGNEIKFSLEQDFKKIYLVNRDTLDSLSDYFEKNLLQKKVHHSFISNVQGKSSSWIQERYDNFPMVKRRCSTAFYFQSPIKHSFNDLNIDIEPNLQYIFISPERVEDELENLSIKLDADDYDKIRARFYGLILLHEYAHGLFPMPIDIPYILAEGIANWISYMIPGDYETRHILSEYALAQDNSYNHYMYMMKLSNFVDILTLIILKNNVYEAFELYSKSIGGNVIFHGGPILSKGPVGGFIGFGEREVIILTSEKIEFIANIRSGIIVSSEIEEIVGRVNPSTKIFSNKINRIDDYRKLPDNIFIVSKKERDFHKEIIKLDSDNVWDYIESLSK